MSRSRSFLEGSRSLCKVMSHSVAGSEIPSLMASFCSLFVVLMTSLSAVKLWLQCVSNVATTAVESASRN